MYPKVDQAPAAGELRIEEPSGSRPVSIVERKIGREHPAKLVQARSQRIDCGGVPIREVDSQHAVRAASGSKNCFDLCRGSAERLLAKDGRPCLERLNA